MFIPSLNNSRISGAKRRGRVEQRPYNVLINLARLGAPFQLFGAGLIGKDPLGEAILADCQTHKIDARHLRGTGEAPTSYTDVMTEQATGRRTFFIIEGPMLYGAETTWTLEG